ncbi:tRNA lysidine(34) synthetase TilS [Pseudomonas sp. G.S.17]|uniref:tRNA lysidine(34) synthetase TilS n=1 Tax=Pseudomonas sp. G.S.17 TaxID=3137451 RepID=UPI00311C9C50
MTTHKHPHDLPARLAQALAPWRHAPVWHVGFSGGLDSTVLLHALADLARRETLPPINAIHVHHGLQAAADAWPAHCQQVCDALGVSLQVMAVQVKAEASLEQAARDARYAAFTATLKPDEVLLTAQHQDDQAETLLFRLLRGAGLRGLAAMPVSRALGEGSLLRPLLGISRADLEAYGREHQLAWIEDPSNNDVQFSRNYLRNQVMPALTSRWPQAAANLARTAAHLDEAQQLLNELAEQDLIAARSDSLLPWVAIPSLALAPLVDLSAARQRNALRHWLAPLTRLPDSDHWRGWEDLRDAGQDARPVWRLADGELHRAEGRIWWLSGDFLQPLKAVSAWGNLARPLRLPGNGQLCIEGNIPAGSFEVRYRQGGEILHLPGRGHRDLKRLLNERGIPLFVRGRLPLLYRNGQLLAVANLPELNADAHGDWRLQWQAPTNDQSLS